MSRGWLCVEIDGGAKRLLPIGQEEWPWMTLSNSLRISPGAATDVIRSDSPGGYPTTGLRTPLSLSAENVVTRRRQPGFGSIPPFCSHTPFRLPTVPLPIPRSAPGPRSAPEKAGNRSVSFQPVAFLNPSWAPLVLVLPALTRVVLYTPSSVCRGLVSPMTVTVFIGYP